MNNDDNHKIVTGNDYRGEGMERIIFMGGGIANFSYNFALKNAII